MQEAQRLFMLVKRRPLAGEPGAPSSGSQTVWQFPVVQHKEGESLRWVLRDGPWLGMRWGSGRGAEVQLVENDCGTEIM